MAPPKRVGVQHVRERLQSGASLVLVCAYPNDEAFKRAALEGSISYPDFEKRLVSLKKNVEIVFY